MLTYNRSISMVRMFRKAIFAALLSICLFITAIAQDSDRVIERGLHTSGIIGQTDLNDSRISGLVQPFIRYELSRRLDGEFSIGLGILNSRDYQTRLLPINYGIHFYPFEPDYSPGNSLIQRSDFFLYTGLGALNYSHIRIPRPDDPLTVDAGRTIPNSTFWSFGSNWTWQLPIGAGMQLQLDPTVNLNLKAGYTFTGSREIEALSGSNRDGYWSVTFGLSFRGREKARQADHTRSPAPHVAVIEMDKMQPESKEGDEAVSDLDLYLMLKSIPVLEYEEDFEDGAESETVTVIDEMFIEQVAELELILLPEPGGVIELEPFYYDEFQMEPSDSDLPKLHLLFDLLMNEPDLNITIVGRSDNDENISKNMLVSLSRAVYVKNFLVESGIDPDRLRVYSNEIFDTPEVYIGGKILIIRSDRSNESDVHLNR